MSISLKLLNDEIFYFSITYVVLTFYRYKYYIGFWIDINYIIKTNECSLIWHINKKVKVGSKLSVYYFFNSSYKNKIKMVTTPNKLIFVNEKDSI